jgi:hypothetical protein
LLVIGVQARRAPVGDPRGRGGAPGRLWLAAAPGEMAGLVDSSCGDDGACVPQRSAGHICAILELTASIRLIPDFFVDTAGNASDAPGVGHERTNQMNRTMSGVIALCVLAGLSFNLPQSAAQTEKPKENETSAQACFAKLKKLAGDWTHKEDKSGKESVTIRYRVISGGTAVEEELLPDSPGAMTSIYHLDNGNLVMTHYCSLGNQPHLRATKASTPSKMEFECVGGGGNMKSENDMHIHHLVFTFQSDNHFTQEWSANKNGKLAGSADTFEAYRKSP